MTAAPGGRCTPLPCPGSIRTRLPWGAIADIVPVHAVVAAFGRCDVTRNSLKHGAVTTGRDRGIHPGKLKRLGRNPSFDVLGEDLESRDLFDGHPLSGVP